MLWGIRRDRSSLEAPRRRRAVARQRVRGRVPAAPRRAPSPSAAASRSCAIPAQPADPSSRLSTWPLIRRRQNRDPAGRSESLSRLREVFLSEEKPGTRPRLFRDPQASCSAKDQVKLLLGETLGKRKFAGPLERVSKMLNGETTGLTLLQPRALPLSSNSKEIGQEKEEEETQEVRGGSKEAEEEGGGLMDEEARVSELHSQAARLLRGLAAPKSPVLRTAERTFERAFLCRHTKSSAPRVQADTKMGMTCGSIMPPAPDSPAREQMPPTEPPA